METITLSSTTITTLVGIGLAVLLFTLFRQTISSFFVSLVVALILVLAFDAVTGYQLLHFGELLAFMLNILMRFFYWVQGWLLPGVTEAVEDVVQSIGA